MSQLVRGGLRGKKRGRKWQELVGYSLDELAVHIERQFLRGMTWQNMGRWHIDHILPRSMFEYENEDDPAFQQCWALTNLRPLWSGDNIRKRDKRIFLI